jgi:multiple sugar transport system permease protein
MGLSGDESMTINLLFALGTILFWIGSWFLLCAVIRKANRIPNAISAGVLFLASSLTPIFQTQFGIPLIWPDMPVELWLATLSFICSIRYIVKAILDRGSQYLKPIIAWFAAAAAFFTISKFNGSFHFEILHGSITLTSASGLYVAAFTVAAVALIAKFGKNGKKIATHAALLFGCILFGMPFAWLIVTSFKESRDTTSASGLVWIPRVQKTIPYFDKSDPLLAAKYEGEDVITSPIGRTSDGGYIVEIQRPSSLRGISFDGPKSSFQEVAKDAPVVKGQGFSGFVVQEKSNGERVVRYLSPNDLRGQEKTFLASELEPVREIGLRVKNYSDALEAMPVETHKGLVYLQNTVILVLLSVIGTVLSSSIVAYAFARLRFPGKDWLFKLLLGTMMLPAAVTLMPQFLLFRSLGWIDTLYPLWVPAFFASAFNVFLLRQFFSQIPMELEDAAKIDGAGLFGSFWLVMMPQVKPGIAVISIWTFMGAWNNFMGPLIYINTPENMPLSYALQLFQTERGGETGLMMAFATLTIIPVIALFFFAQKYFIEGVSLSGLGGR